MNQNFNHPQNAWARLTAAAREVRDERDISAPYGFATRVVALALAQQPPRVTTLFERFAFRAVGVASLLALFSIVLNYDALAPDAAASASSITQVDLSEIVAVDDAVSVVLDFAD